MKKQKLLISLVLLPILAHATPNPNKITTKTNELKNVTQQIKGLQDSLSHDRNQQANLQSQLQKLETNMGQISATVNKINNQLSQQNNILSGLNTRAQQYQTQLDEQRTALSQNVRAAYILGHNTYVKILFNQKNPSEMSRTLTYYKYTNQARLNILANLNHTISNINNTQQQITAHKDNLAHLIEQKQSQQTNLASLVNQRKEVLTNVGHTIQNKSEKLTNLINNKKILEDLLKKLKTTQVVRFQPTRSSGGPFANMKGRLPWPTEGKITEHFASRIEGTDMAANAVNIAAPEEQSVRAVFAGKVVFADWLRGLGLLVIIDHGNGYMTLYGHNHNLVSKVGDLVKPGTVIASVGSTGGNVQTGLYFQIRDNGQPLNPEEWCK